MIRRILFGLLLIAALAIATAFALPTLVPSQMVREQVANQISQLTGRAVTLRGDQALQVFPSLTVELSDVVIEGSMSGPENALIVTETLRGAVRAIPLLFGRIELASFEMTRPVIRLYRDEDGQSNWQLAGGDLESALEPNRVAGAGLQLGRFRITDGTLELVDQARGVEETFTSANLTLAWPTSSTRAQINGTAIWRGEAVDVAASLDQPAALAQPGSTSGVVFSMQGAPLSLQFDGSLSPGATGDAPVAWQAAGELTVSTPSLRRAVNWLGGSLETGSTFGAFRLEGDMNLVGSSLDLTDVQLSLDGNDAEGVLTFELNGFGLGDAIEARPALQGTLDIQRLDLSPYLDILQPTTTVEAPGDWRYLPFPDVFSVPLDVDLRFASREILANALSFGETGGSVLLTSERMVLGIGEAVGYDGIVRGSLTMDNELGTLITQLDLVTDGINVGAVAGAIGQSNNFGGTLSTQILLSGQGETIAEAMQTLTGDGAIVLEEATISGIDLDSLAETLIDGTFSLSNPVPVGSTSNISLSAHFLADAGLVEIFDTNFETPGIAVTVGGQSNLFDGPLDLSGATTISQSDELLIVPFEVRGSWAAPQFLPDMRALDR